MLQERLAADDDAAEAAAWEPFEAGDDEEPEPPEHAENDAVIMAPARIAAITFFMMYTPYFICFSLHSHYSGF